MDDDRSVNASDLSSDSNDSSSLRYPEQAIAVVGAACRFAGADSLEQLWQILETGTSQCADLPKSRIPDFRFEKRKFVRNFRANFINDVDAFDHKFFKVRDREANFRDPQQRLALEVTYQALESAGYFSRNVTEEQRDVGCYFATSTNEYYENVTTHPPSAFSLTGSLRPFIAGQVSHHFGFTGPAIMLDAACAASGVAVNVACRAVASEECTSAVVGATNIFISPTTFQDLACGHFTSPTGPSRSFDVAADGYCRGEGVAAIVIKKLSDALRDGDVIKGVILATATNQCTNESAVNVPHGPSQSSLYSKALQLAQLDADQIGYVEAHGTGTRVGDPIEAESIRAVFGDLGRKPDSKIHMGSLKSNIGHTEASAGLSGLIKMMLMIEKSIIPRQALFTSLNPDIPPLEPYGLQIPTKTLPWASNYRVGCVNNYGASGCNAVMILAQPPGPVKTGSTSQITTYPFTINAFSQTSLSAYCSALLQFIGKADANDSLALDICFHLSRRRNPELPFSITRSISNLDDLQRLLTSTPSDKIQNSDRSKRSTVLFFGGQDGKVTNLSRELYHSCAILRKHIDDCEANLKELGYSSILPALFDPDKAESSVLEHLKLFSVQYASAKAWIDCGLQPSRLVGHSFGQITALCVSGVLSLQDALRLVTGRARLIDEAWGPDTGSMIAIEASGDELSELLERHSDLSLEIACYNGAQSFVLAGSTASVGSMETALKSSPKSHRFKRLQVRNAFHSVLAESLVKPLQDIVEGLSLQDPKIPLETCSEHGTWSSFDPFVIAAQIRDPVYFHQAVQRIARQLGPCVWIEAGSGSNASLLRRALEPQTSSHCIKSITIDSPSSPRQLSEVTAELWTLGFKIQFWPFHHDQRHQYQMLNLPPYQFDKTRHWLEWQELGAQPAAEGLPIREPKPFVHLVQETKDGYEFEINTQFKSWRESCAENRILGVSVCPISLLLDLCSEAIGTIHASAQEACGYCLQNVEISTPIPADLNQNLSLKIGKVDFPNSWTFRLARTPDSHHALASGTIHTDRAEVQDEFFRFERLIDVDRVKELEGDANTDCIKGRGIYKVAAELFQAPRSTQTIQKVSARGNEVAASLVLPSGSSSIAMEILIQVPLIYLNGMHEYPNGHFFINIAIGNARMWASVAASIDTKNSYLVYLKFFQLERFEPTCDMYVFNKRDGRMCAVLLDLSFSLVPIKSLRQVLEGETTTLSQQLANCEEIPLAISSTSESRVTTDLELESHQCHTPRTDALPDLTQTLFDLLARIADAEVDRLCETTLITDLGIDSLMAMEVADEINQVFAVKIELSDFLAAEDLRTLCQLIASQATGFYYDSDASSSTPPCTTAGSDTTASSLNAEEQNDYRGHTEAHSSLASRETVSTNLKAASKAFDDIRTQFDVLARETGCDTFWSEIHPAQTRLIEAYVVEAFAKLGCNLISLKAGERIPAIPHKSGRYKLIKQLMLVLRDAGLIKQSGNDWLRTNTMPGQLSSVELFNQIQVRFPKWAPEHELLHVAGSNLAGNLDGTQNPLKLLFGTPEKRKLMADQYFIAPVQSAVSRQLAAFIEKCFASQTPNKPFQILEVGGGTCGTTVYALDAFVKAGVPVEYTFTDISPSFIAAAKSKLKGYTFVKYHALDISKEPPVELQGQYDMILATNVIHATQDAAKSARHVRQMLRSGGFFSMVEYTRIYAAVDVIFGQLDGWWLFDDGRTHAIMDEHQWDATLRLAGYNKIDWTGSRTRESEISRIFLAY